MIEVNKGEVQIKNVTRIEMITEFSCVISTVYHALIDNGFRPAFAKELMDRAYEASFMSDEEIEAEIEKHDMATHTKVKELFKILFE